MTRITRKRTAPSRRTWRPILERLEDRLAPAVFTPAAEDPYEPNNDPQTVDLAAEGGTSPKLGLVTAQKSILGLSLEDDADWYQFRTGGVGVFTDSVTVSYPLGGPGLVLTVFRQDKSTVVGFSDSRNGFEQVRLNGEKTGTYYIRITPVTPGQGATSYSLGIDPPAPLTDDPLEVNNGSNNNSKPNVDQQTEAAVNSSNFGLLTAPKSVLGLILNDAAGEEWYRFSTDGVATAAANVTVSYNASDSLLVLTVFRDDGQAVVGFSDSRNGFEQVKLTGERTGTYYIRVRPVTGGSGSANYSLSIVPPQPLADDGFEDNDGKPAVDARAPGIANSPNLGLLTAPKSLLHLVLDDTQDWYRFRTADVATAVHRVTLTYNPTDGLLVLVVYRSNGLSVVGFSDSRNGVEQVDLNGELAGTYYAKVVPVAGGDGHADYSLQIEPPITGQAISLSVTPSTVVEGDGANAATGTVRRSGSLAGSLTVTLASSDTSGIRVPATVVIPDGQPSATFAVQALTNGVAADTRDVTITASAAGMQPEFATLTLLDNEPPPVVSINNLTVNEGETTQNAQVIVRLSTASGLPVTVQYTTADGTATGADYQGTSGTLTFQPGETARTIPVPIRGDTLIEQAETVLVNLTAANNATLPGGLLTGTVTIKDNDGTQTQRFVAQVYVDLLRRPVDQGGLSFWGNFLSQPGNTRTSMVRMLEDSSEARAVVVRDAYTTFLRRPADDGGLGLFVGMIGGGATVEDVQAELIGSDEYYRNRGGNNDDGFLDALFQDVLMRAIDAPTRASLKARLMSGTPRSQIAEEILTTDEGRRKLIQGFYPKYLRRASDAGGVEYFLGRLKGGARQEDVVAELLASDEYFRLAQP
jgi:hypothetical protein